MSKAHSDDSLNEDRLSGSTLASSRIRGSTNGIPTPGGSKPLKPYKPFILRLPIVIGTPLNLLLLGLALEVGIFISNVNNGFRVPQNNAFNVFGNVSGQFLASFIPTLLVIPVAYLFRELDWNVRVYQPYILMQKGSAPAESSLLLDYVRLGPMLSIFRAHYYKHKIVYWSSLTAVLTYAFQPLTGSIFQIRQAEQKDGEEIRYLLSLTKLTFELVTAVTSIKNIGLNNDPINDLNGFMAAAGYTDASAILNNVGDPPFVRNGWATAEVLFPANKFLNGTMSVSTAGIQTNANCSNPTATPVLNKVGNTNVVNLTSSSLEGCTHSVSFDPTAVTQQYGVEDVLCPGEDPGKDVRFRRVMFWFFDGQDARTVFCTPQISALNVTAIANLNDGSLINVVGGDPYIIDNNVFGAPQNGQAFNGVIFPPTDNSFIQARANATRSIVPGTIFHAAQLLKPNGVQTAFSIDNRMMDLTTQFYTRHLAVSAKSIYFVDQNSTLTANVSSLVPRLVIDPLPAHFLAIILIITGIIGMLVHFNHRRQRQTLKLAAPPGSIASVVALTSRSGFGDMLYPYDDEATLEKKLDGLRFRLDRRTGAILAEDLDSEAPDGMGRDDAMLSLLGKGQLGKGKSGDAYKDLPSANSHSSFAAYQMAGGSTPPPMPMNWERSWDPSSRSASPLKGESSNQVHTEYVP
ncbi:hypothetical protein D9619_008744 [Psilocybe cf. subviscida]|uniref:Uncharacterized protein n=1 Tax=Psilocybe cf. subviscida TaxID=2480587 RepID=A0A8H5BB45_9AGAR|nr:hypothetical protein D9619_008744 [Psilocybe cf. subviscida]